LPKNLPPLTGSNPLTPVHKALTKKGLRGGDAAE